MQQTEYLEREIIWQIISKGFSFSGNRGAFEASNVQLVCANGQALSILSLFAAKVTVRDRDYSRVKRIDENYVSYLSLIKINN